jgi:hypothetical protein
VPQYAGKQNHRATERRQPAVDWPSGQGCRDGYLEDRSSIVKTFALQGLADLAAAEPSVRETVIQTLQEARRKGTAAMKARSKKLLRGLEND